MRRLVVTLVLVSAGCTQREEPPATSRPAADTISVFERRTAADPRDHLSPTTLAELHLARAERSHDPAEYRRAEAAARTALERQKDHPGAIVALARSAAGQGRTDEARHLLDGLLDLHPRYVGALAAEFDLAFEAHDEARSQAFADRLLAVNEEPVTLRRLGQVAERGGDVDRAVELYRRAAKVAADLGGLTAEIADAHRRAGAALLAAGRSGEAAREYDAALAVDPHDDAALRGRDEARASHVGAAAKGTR